MAPSTWMSRFARVSRAVAIAVAVCLIAALLWAMRPGDEARSLIAYFPRAVAVYPGSDVKILGVRVGQVDSVEPEGERVEVTVEAPPHHVVEGNDLPMVLGGDARHDEHEGIVVDDEIPPFRHARLDGAGGLQRVMVTVHGEVLSDQRVGRLPDRAAPDHRAAFRRRHIAGQYPHRRRFSGAIWTEKAEDFSSLHAKADVVYSRNPAVSFAEMLNLDHDYSRPRCSRTRLRSPAGAQRVSAKV